MITHFFDFYPFSIESGPEFLGFYLFLIIATVGVLLALRRYYGEYLDQKVDHGVLQRLAIGQVPRTTEHFALAYLTDGERGVANTLMAVALASGYLARRAAGFYLNYKPAEVSTPILKYFLDRLQKSSASAPPSAAGATYIALEVRTAASATATRYEEQLRSQLEREGLLRAPMQQAYLRTTLWLVAGLILGVVGGVRILRALELGRPFLFLVIEMGLAAIWVNSIARDVADSSRKATYLSWLKNSTTSLHSSVDRGGKESPTEVGLAVAIYGTAVVGAGLSALLADAWVPMVAPVVASSVGSSGGSSCGGGGGGGCGG